MVSEDKKQSLAKTRAILAWERSLVREVHKSIKAVEQRIDELPKLDEPFIAGLRAEIGQTRATVRSKLRNLTKEIEDVESELAGD